MNTHEAATIYTKVLAAMEREAPFDEIHPLIKSLADLGEINRTDYFGLTISMRAAGLGRLDVVKAAHALKAPLEMRNKLTNANLLHYAAQQPEGGAGIIKWAILDEKASDDLLNQQILVVGHDRDTDKDWDRGNGHTVAFEAVFNDTVEVVQALIEIENQGHKVDFTTPAVHGRSPLGWALKTDANEIVKLLGPKLHPHSTDKDVWRKEEDSTTEEYAERENAKWISSHPQDIPALNLAQQLRWYIVNGPTQEKQVEDLLNLAFKDVDLNKPYGRFGQPLLILVPTHPDIMNLTPDQDQKNRYTEVVSKLIAKHADPRTKEKGLMEVSAGFREVFFDYMDALEFMILNVPSAKREDFVNEIGFFNGYTRLIDAALIGREAAIELLCRHDANRGIKGFNGWTACKAAKIYNSKPQKVRIHDRVLATLCDGQERRGLPEDNAPWQQPGITGVKPITDEEIATRAYYLFKQRGHQHGDDWKDWFRAEDELR